MFCDLYSIRPLSPFHGTVTEVSDVVQAVLRALVSSTGASAASGRRRACTSNSCSGAGVLVVEVSAPDGPAHVRLESHALVPVESITLSFFSSRTAFQRFQCLLTTSRILLGVGLRCPLTRAVQQVEAVESGAER